MTPSLALSRSAKSTAKEIADICIDNWKQYGVLPSVAIAQAFIESGLGSGPNLFGVLGCAGMGTYSSTIRYLQCINNGYYRGAPFQKDHNTQIYYILRNGNYCAGEYAGGRYHGLVNSSINRYNWDDYDSKLFNDLRKAAAKERRRERKKRQRGYFHIVIDESLTPGTAITDPKYIRKGSVILYEGGILEVVKTKRNLGNKILTGCESIIRIFAMPEGETDGFFDLENLQGTRLREVVEDAKG